MAVIEKQLETPPMPLALNYLVTVFFRLRDGCTSDNPIHWVDIDAFCRLLRFRLTPWEIEVISRLDYVYSKVIANRRNEENKIRASSSSGNKGFKSVSQWKT